MFSHVFVGVSDFEKALNFYQAVLGALGLEQRFCQPDKPWAGWHSAGGVRPLFVISHPFNGEAHHSGNGQMIALVAQDRATVRAVHQLALSHGGTCEGPPGLRPQYHSNYYGTYFRDPDGNKLSVVCHEPETALDPGKT